MTLAIGHFAVGVSGTMVMFHMLPLRIRLKMRFVQMFIVIVGGLLAMLPDLVQYTNVFYYINSRRCLISAASIHQRKARENSPAPFFILRRQLNKLLVLSRV